MRKSTHGVLFSMCLSLVLVVASVSAINLALPDLAVELNASNIKLTWIADGYTVALAALVLPIGALGDRLGRRNVLIAGTVVFGAASLAAALSNSATELIVWRVVMGAGAAMIMPGTLSTITAAFPPEQRVRGVATWSGFASAGAILGLLAAGALLERWSWTSIFFVSAGTAVLAGIAAALLAPNTKDAHPSPPDVLGTIFTSVGIGTLVFTIIEGSEKGWTEPVVLVGLVLCVLAFAAYAIHGLRVHHPLLDPRLFGRPAFRAGAITVLVQFMAVFGFFYVGLQYLQLILGYSPLLSAVALIPVAATVLPISMLTPRVERLLGLNVTMCAGLLALAGGLLWIATLDTASGYLPFLGGLLVAGVGVGVTSSTGTSAIVGSLSVRQQGVASAMNDTTREVGSAVGIALMGALFSSSYGSHLPDLSGLPAEAADAVRASAPGGLAVAEHLGAAGAQLADQVKDSFMHGLSASLIAVCAIVAVAGVGSLFRAPRHLPSTAEPDPAGHSG